MITSHSARVMMQGWKQLLTGWSLQCDCEGLSAVRAYCGGLRHIIDYGSSINNVDYVPIIDCIQPDLLKRVEPLIELSGLGECYYLGYTGVLKLRGFNRIQDWHDNRLYIHLRPERIPEKIG